MHNQDQKNFYEEAEKTNKKWYSFLLNKYLIVSAVFIVWMIFLDQNSVLVHLQRSKEIKTLEEDEQYYLGKLKEESERLNDLKNNPAELERIAREKHFLKRNNEDIFIIQEERIIKQDSVNNEK
ncbi:FtsB family cell division protein [Weeksella virosa]|uniref:Septum formation initiator n=1 Tax=Weeksella virosa (strain ATCC 43766 / DSM 16922 / JCM 21250 / CCUG 30538 / CDC 9751 / IAM 14551 / NBRC 16016 / NCTC 11634 / CL345/78) TaxID=865938 RepID=F0P0K3_WEEVC|nr:septum formation initiator family protein [Weeksella virosa]ADX68502.1 Septum formation initiator [Weeksella virosa DSM 16922]MDK7675327.1 septum formation initiator family protein [Weeksella virosa]SUP54836.1 Septum formation initiator [Weeksella virosa]VEH63841.1 Septum formation initiator [Weeksella virosa]